MDYEIANQISAEEYNEMRKIVGWQALSNEQRNGIYQKPAKARV